MAIEFQFFIYLFKLSNFQ